MNSDPTSISRKRELDRLCELEFVFVTGKGGVGKSTTAGLIAFAAAERGKSALVVHPIGSQVHDGLWGKHLTEEPQEVAPGISAAQISPEHAMREYARSILKSKTVVDGLFHSNVARGFLTGLPGLPDWAILGKTWAWTKTGSETIPLAQDKYDIVILDAPASGDGSKMLGVPQVLLDLAPAGRLRADAEACLKMLRDPIRSAVILVSLAEQLVVTETEENLELVRHALRMPLGPLFINQLLSPAFSPEDSAEIERLAGELTAPAPGQAQSEEEQIQAAALKIGAERILQERLQAVHLERLSRLDLPLLPIVHQKGHLRGPEALKKLQMSLAQGA